jgi:hypothetical protein
VDIYLLSDQAFFMLTHVEFRYLVIDEADRMMANITDNWLASLESAVYRLEKLSFLLVFLYSPF